MAFYSPALMQHAVVAICFVALLAICQAQEEPSLLELCNATPETRQLCVRILGDLASQGQEQDQMNVDKRKASFIRFGKRSAPEYDLNEIQKRKASFIRFGRK